MKNILFLITLILSVTCISSQNVPVQTRKKVAPNDTIVPDKGTRENQIKKIDETKVKLLSDSLGNEPRKSALIDTTKQNKYGNLLEDDPEYNKRYPFWIPAAEVLGTVTLTWTMDRYLINAPYARTGFNTWKDNLKNGWEWDNDRFGINFIGHPYSGTLTYNAGRSNGYNYYQSFGMALGGSLLWEYFGENTHPSYNDIIYTPVNGSFIGEILYWKIRPY